MGNSKRYRCENKNCNSIFPNSFYSEWKQTGEYVCEKCGQSFSGFEKQYDISEKDLKSKLKIIRNSKICPSPFPYFPIILKGCGFRINIWKSLEIFQ
jgi:hypothetical protein